MSRNWYSIKPGLRTEAEDFAERGVDWQDAKDQRQPSDLCVLRATRLAKTFSADGMTFDRALELLQQRSPNPTVPPAPAITPAITSNQG